MSQRDSGDGRDALLVSLWNKWLGGDQWPQFAIFGQPPLRYS
jgi:hypothetical protein